MRGRGKDLESEYKDLLWRLRSRPESMNGSRKGQHRAWKGWEGNPKLLYHLDQVLYLIFFRVCIYVCLFLVMMIIFKLQCLGPLAVSQWLYGWGKTSAQTLLSYMNWIKWILNRKMIRAW